MTETFLVLGLSFAIILASCELFTNGIEWLGRKLDLGEGAVGSILAAVGTAMPETLIPLVAIILVGGEAAHEIGIGAILGAPFVLSTLAMLVTGTAISIFTLQGRRGMLMNVNHRILQRDMTYFMGVYVFAVLAAFIHVYPIKAALAVALFGVYGVYVFITMRDEAKLPEGDPHPLHFHRVALVPALERVGLQVIVSLAGIIIGARIFVNSISDIAVWAGVSPLVLSLIIAPLATELPEKFNSVIWVRRSKDTLAMGNITGAMVFQSCIPVAVGLLLTSWELTPPALISAIIALVSTLIISNVMRFRERLNAQTLILGGLFYLGFIGYVIQL
ncbi:MAG: sodium:calcium antiporter [Chloroflexi bacterium]|nr:sodium:calcium antiporter [Chloroflexota bacterium]